MNRFDYAVPDTLAAALELLGSNDEAKLLAGGQTLVPTMKQGLAAPELLVDLNGINELAAISVTDSDIRVGAMCRHNWVATSSGIVDKTPGLAELAGMIGDAQVRNRGTIGGSVANNDPAADYPSALLALNATVRTDRRDIAADDFFLGLFETALEPGEMIREVVFPTCRSSAYAKFRNPASRFAMVGVFVARLGDNVRVAVTGAGSDGVFRWTEAEGVLNESFAEEALEGLAVDPEMMLSDMHAGAEYRANLVAVMTKRAVKLAATRR
ncbi:FAD binding domain-containing protein [Mesorhizobium sp. ANAO-SY3R2]|uniref:FAD binding domain-containing protein n=1 Tax=Mesorhizobium sp. ANAO-SY3R2 TaxID=3166644 RepID=UPI003672D696